MSEWESEEEFDDLKHKQLLESLFKNDESKGKKKAFQLKKGAEEKVNIADMLSALKGKKGLDIVKKNFGIHTTKDLKKIQDKCLSNEENRGKGLKSKTLVAPMHKHAQDKIQAQVAYSDIKTELGEWNQVVSSNRVAEQIKFPLDQEKLHNLGNAERLEGKIPRTSLEQKMQQIISGSKHILDNNRPYTEAEEELLKAMDLKEAEEKIKKLQRERKLMSFRAAKNKYKAKIKSKTYHRIQNRSKRRKLVKEFEELVTKDPEAAKEKLAEIEKDRLLERATLRHRTTGKWNRNLIKYAARNEGVRKILQEHIRFGKELKAKLLGIDQDELSESEGEGENNNEEIEKKDYQTFMSMVAEEAAKEAKKEDKKDETIVSALLDGEKNPWLKKGLLKLRKAMKAKEEEKRGFVTKVSDKRKKEIVKEMDLDEGWTIVGPKDEEYVVSKEDVIEDLEVDEDEIEDNEEDIKFEDEEIESEEDVSKQEPSGKTIDEIFDEYFDSLITTTKLEEEAEDAMDTSNKIDDEEDGEPEAVDVPSCSLKRKGGDSLDNNENKKLKSTIDISLDPSKYLNLVTNNIEAIDDKINEHLDDGNRIHSLDQTNLIAEAFEDDDVISEFEKHKAKIEDEEREKDIDLTLHGWGSWTGAGIETKSKKEFVLKAPKKIRKDSNKHGIIIRQNVDSSIEKYQPDDVPFPYTSAKVYEAVIRQPIGMDWNTVNTNKELITPNVLTRLGKIIRPISKDTLKKSIKLSK
uniref:U3 small nucleolar RNA-associated protein 14 homolog A n=1 Tax=Strongyloides papillosus TaxID=174720 RepID=A0A0N5BVM9_STREA